MPESIRPVDPAAIDLSVFKKQLADAIVMTKDGKLLMQQRTPDWGKSAGKLTAFGGHVEDGETALQALKRELKEELGADVNDAELISLGGLTEEETGHTEIVHAWFWHDKRCTITGCYECEAAYYDRAAGALAHPMIMDYAVWMLKECEKRGLVK
ncbi:MAG: NUDIX hydrolase [Alphaproteobacteria bacterium]